MVSVAVIALVGAAYTLFPAVESGVQNLAQDVQQMLVQHSLNAGGAALGGPATSARPPQSTANGPGAPTISVPAQMNGNIAPIQDKDLPTSVKLQRELPSLDDHRYDHAG